MTSPAIKAALEKAAKAAWDAERAEQRRVLPEWPMPAWSRARAYRKRPYIAAAVEAAAKEAGT